jgi:uncharacterized membrane protein (DUF2068 family)
MTVLHGKRHWHLETIVCAFRGHETPAANVLRLRPEDAGLGVELPDGRRLARCLRCDAWIQVTQEALSRAEVLPPLDQLEVPRRARPLHDAVVLRLIAVDRAIHSVLFGLLALVLIDVYVRFGSIRLESDAIVRALERVLRDTSGQDASRSFLVRELTKFGSLSRHTIAILAGTAVVYCTVEAVEAVGLWLEKRWAEYLTAIATAGFLPFEIRELIKRVTVLRIAALVVNVAILAWLLWRKRLFGIGGGLPPAEEIDRLALFGPPGKAETEDVRASAR